MWDNNWREITWDTVRGPWDILIIGGGITGAGILREATRLGLHALLVEQRDFAWGTSSRSSKLVHGGFRYLKEGKLMLTRNSVHEREQLLHEGPGLIDPLGFLLTVHKGDFPGRWTYALGLTVYDLLALRWDHDYYSPQDFQLLAPHISQDGLQGGFRFGDAQTDDARLTLRVIREAVADGATAINYVKAQNLIVEAGDVKGVLLTELVHGQQSEAYARVVINATGAWADTLREQAGGTTHIRPLRGSHLIFPNWRLPVAQAVSFLHPFDNRPVFIFPWESVTLVGTTDVDHVAPLELEPKVSPEEVTYLMAAVEYQFPSLAVSLEDVISTYAGVRPVIGCGKLNPSEESRDHVIWEENGLFTVTGGKLTTFRLIGLDVLNAIRHRIPEMREPDHHMPVLNQIDHLIPGCADMSDGCRRRLLGRLGSDALEMVDAAQPGEMDIIPGTNYLWAELRWAARSEGVCHLEDLLLRRTRLGLILPHGAVSILPSVKQICRAELNWSENHWQQEQSKYLAIWADCYSLPPKETIPDWKSMLVDAQNNQKLRRLRQRYKFMLRSSLTSLIAILSIFLIALYWRHTRQSR
ncbi:MAG: FAD-dependent oxidoreductase [Chloroflexi bacterium RBG_16_47_49]|nr:MAG: FAD-dependent oxidoreductase [Chloroflexi bacterium RBG_16_47_49]